MIGLSVALFLARGGRAITLLERDAVGGATSWGNCGLVTPSHADPLTQWSSVKTALGSVLDPSAPLHIAPTCDPRRLRWLLGFARRCDETHRRHARGARWALISSTRELMRPTLGEAHADTLAERGLVTVFRDPTRLDASIRVHEALGRLGLRYERWAPDALHGRVPGLARDLAGAVFAASDGHVDPRVLCGALRALAEQAGVRIVEGVEVTGLAVERGRVVGARTADDVHTAALTVLAAGPWSARLARGLGLRLPIEPGKGYSITWSEPVGGLGDVPLYFHERKVVATPWAHGFRLGSTMELAGYDDALSPRRLRGLVEGANAYLAAPLQLGPGRAWQGWRPMSVDELPLVGPSATHQGLWYATGHGMMGVSQSLATGRLLAELLGDAAPHVDPAPYRPARFGL